MKTISLFISVLMLFSVRAPFPPRVITLVAAGDDLIHSSVYKDAKTEDGYDFRPIFSGIKEIVSSADIACINQETPLGESNYSGYPRFCTPKQIGDALSDVGFDVIGIANNHMLDQGDAGLKFTYEYLSSTAEAVVGYTENDYAIIERGGVKIGFAAFTYSTNCGGKTPVPRLNEKTVRILLARVRKKCDVLVVSAHFGDEFDSGEYKERFEPSESQKYYAKLFSECGADIVIGAHPHVIQKAEWIKTDGRRTFCVYSLGNLLSNMRYGAQMLGCLLRVRIVSWMGVTFVAKPELIPTVCHFSSAHKGYAIYPLWEYDDGLASLHGTNDEKNEKRFCMETLTLYYENNIDAEFRAEEYKRGKEK